MQIKKINTWLPVFPGFYNTLFDTSDNFYRFEESLKEDSLIPQDLNLNFDYARFNKDVLELCCKWVEKQLPEETGVINVKFEKIVSPKEYNFKNDSGDIEVELDIEKFSIWFNEYLNGKSFIKNNGELVWIKEPNNEAWQKHLDSHYQSRSGFISFYPYNNEDWAELTNNYRFDKKIEYGVYYRGEELINGQHSLGRCLEFYLENEDKQAYQAMYYFCSEKICPEDYISNLPEISYEDRQTMEYFSF